MPGAQPRLERLVRFEAALRRQCRSQPAQFAEVARRMAVCAGVCAVEDRRQQGAVTGSGAKPVPALLKRLGQRHEARVLAAVDVGELA
jgi:hypothetical protein